MFVIFTNDCKEKNQRTRAGEYRHTDVLKKISFAVLASASLQ